MSANLENSAVVRGLEKVNFHSNLKEGQYQKLLQLLYKCTHFTCQQGYAQNPSSYVLAVHELRTYRCTNWLQKKALEPEIKLPSFIESCRKQENFRKTSTCASLTKLKPLTLWITTNCGKFLEMGIPDHTCLPRNLYAGQEAIVKIVQHSKAITLQFKINTFFKSNRKNPDMEKVTGSTSGKKYVILII